MSHYLEQNQYDYDGDHDTIPPKPYYPSASLEGRNCYYCGQPATQWAGGDDRNAPICALCSALATIYRDRKRRF